MSPRQGAPASLRLLIAGLGVTQIISWGTLYYSIAVLAQPIQAELGFSEIQVFGAFTVALIASGLASPFVGRQIDRHGGRATLASGSALGAAAFALIGASGGPASFVLGWFLAGLAMSACLYEGAFATLNKSVPAERYRRALSALTLFGGFASTVFWPATHFLVEGLGWREACFAYCALHLLVCVPLHLWVIPARAERSASAPATNFPHPAQSTQPATHIGALSAAFASNALIFSVMSVYLVQILAGRGLSQGEAIGLAALVGPFQVAARVVEYALAKRVRAALVGTASFAMLLAALALLAMVGGPSLLAFAFIALYGASNGIMTIARGTVPAALFGNANYGALLGRLALPSFISKAFAPALFAGLITLGLSFDQGLLVLAACAAFSWGAYEIALKRQGTLQRRGSDS